MNKKQFVSRRHIIRRPNDTAAIVNAKLTMICGLAVQILKEFGDRVLIDLEFSEYEEDRESLFFKERGIELRAWVTDIEETT